MANKKEKNSVKSSEEVAENSYQPSDYKSSEEVEQGLAMTHEQVSDSYVEGTIDGQIDNYEGQDIDLPKDGYEKDVFKEK
ncbi:YozQ family protein [Alkalihalobacillus sp. MEB130]|uniref:YozQ family protein n=1 Tax=Alkalihalobacillus sp. MEB130 TaxID=2976704 RepID=UPI0028DF0BDF|nr:YozQ family protein [Alkalihalobacillus sp. MEB130]MDT8859214.1 YozQ family protein [Alkalihalobacillus sp. MEB130]